MAWGGDNNLHQKNLPEAFTLSLISGVAHLNKGVRMNVSIRLTNIQWALKKRWCWNILYSWNSEPLKIMPLCNTGKNNFVCLFVFKCLTVCKKHYWSVRVFARCEAVSIQELLYATPPWRLFELIDANSWETFAFFFCGHAHASAEHFQSAGWPVSWVFNSWKT